MSVADVLVLRARLESLQQAEYEATLRARRVEKALPPPDRLRLLADYVDSLFPEDSRPDVQTDLRAWAIEIEAVQVEGPW